MAEHIYLDNAATTPILPEVLEAMRVCYEDSYANPSAIHTAGVKARYEISKARETIAQAINADPEEIFFTSGGTESDNLAVQGVWFLSDKTSRKKICHSAVEHHAVLDTCSFLAKQGAVVQSLPVGPDGKVLIGEALERIDDQTLLVSVMHSNNEMGVIQPAEEIGDICKRQGALFHVDAVQSFGKIPLDVERIQCDLLSISAHKIYGPKGIGCLYIREGTQISPILHGGGQEKGMRSGTLNTQGIVGFGKAVEIAMNDLDSENERLTRLRDHLVRRALAEIEDVALCGDAKDRLPNNVQLLFKGLEGETLVLELDRLGIFASSGSACSSESKEVSHVLQAMGIPREWARGALRLTLGRWTSFSDVDKTVDALVRITRNIRKLNKI
jgi:cysteine desulfurase